MYAGSSEAWRKYEAHLQPLLRALGDPLACPLLADPRRLPPAFTAIADRDLLLEENLLMASRLAQAGVRVRPVVYPGTAHSFLETVSVAA